MQVKKSRLPKLEMAPQFERAHDRLDLYRSDRVMAKFEGYDETFRLFDISPFGFGVVHEHRFSKAFPSGSSLRVRIEHSGGSYETLATPTWSGEYNGQRRSGFRFCDDRASDQQKDLKFLILPQKALVSGTFFAEGRYYERHVFHLVGISKTQIMFRIFDTALMLLPGMRLKLEAHLGRGPEDQMIVEVTRAQSPEASLLKDVTIAANIISMPKGLSKRIGSFIFEVSDFTLGEVRAAGLKVGSVAERLRFRYVRSEHDYHEVLKLRFKAYKEAGKVADGKTYLDMAAPLDHISRIMAAYHGDRIVASVAMTFPMDESVILDTERPFEGHKYPQPVPLKSNTMEVARLCTDSDYRNGDLLKRMFEHIYKGMHCGDRQYIITSCDQKLWPLYKRIGFKKSGMVYDHPFLAGIKHDVIILDRTVVDSIWGIGALDWTYFFLNMNTHLQRRGLLPANHIRRAGLFVSSRVLKPIIKRLMGK